VQIKSGAYPCSSYLLLLPSVVFNHTIKPE
jgi:hypothetical protein